MSFSYLKPGDTVTRMLAGTVPMVMTVEKIDVENDLIYMQGGWAFDIETGHEVDEEIMKISEGLGFPPAIISFLVKEEPK